MSKERELLRRWLIDFGKIHPSVELLRDTQELLAQPEQEQEPVAWRGINFTEAEGDWLYRDIEDPFTDSNYRSVGEALYLAPPKREPLSDGELPTYNPKINTDGERLAFHAGIRWAEHQHGIGL